MSVHLNPYITLEGTAKEAVYFYEKVLGGTVINVMTFADMPADPNYPIPEEAKGRVMHAMLKVGNTELMFSDTFPGMPHQAGDTVQLALHPKEESQAQALFTALSDGGEVIMPLQKTDWSPMYGIVRDKFGVMFQVNVAVDQQ